MELRHLLVGAWYPLLPYSRDPRAWMASQYHRPDLGKGLVLVFRRGESPYRSAEVSLRGLEPGAMYELVFDTTRAKSRVTGAELMGKYAITLPRPRSSELILYAKAPEGSR